RAPRDAASPRGGGGGRYGVGSARHPRFSWQDETLTVGVPNRHFQEWLERKFTKDVAAAAREVFGRPMDVSFHIDAQLFQAARREQQTVEEAKNAPPAPVRGGRESPVAAEQEADAPRSPKRTRRSHRLADFVVGPCNRVAH